MTRHLTPFEFAKHLQAGKQVNVIVTTLISTCVSWTQYVCCQAQSKQQQKLPIGQVLDSTWATSHSTRTRPNFTTSMASAETWIHHTVRLCSRCLFAFVHALLYKMILKNQSQVRTIDLAVQSSSRYFAHVYKNYQHVCLSFGVMSDFAVVCNYALYTTGARRPW